MSKREKLVDVIDATMPVPIPHAILEVAIDAILDELMEPGEVIATHVDMVYPNSDVRDDLIEQVLFEWQSVLTHIKDGKP